MGWCARSRACAPRAAGARRARSPRARARRAGARSAPGRAPARSARRAGVRGTSMAEGDRSCLTARRLERGGGDVVSENHDAATRRSGAARALVAPGSAIVPHADGADEGAQLLVVHMRGLAIDALQSRAGGGRGQGQARAPGPGQMLGRGQGRERVQEPARARGRPLVRRGKPRGARCRHFLRQRRPTTTRRRCLLLYGHGASSSGGRNFDWKGRPWEATRRRTPAWWGSGSA